MSENLRTVGRRIGKTAAMEAWKRDHMANMKPGDRLLIMSARDNIVITRNPNQIENKNDT